MLHQINRAVEPTFPLREVVANWNTVAFDLAENPRRRMNQTHVMFMDAKTS